MNPLPSPSDRGAVFARRFFSAITLWVLVIAAIVINHELGYFAIIAAIGLAGLYEYYHMLRHKDAPHFLGFGMAAAAIFFLVSFAGEYGTRWWSVHTDTIAVFTFIFGAFVCQCMFQSRNPFSIEAIAFTVFGLLYIPFLFNFLTKLIYLPAHPSHDPGGHYYVFYLLVVAKFSDMGAYLVGSAVGKHKMFPTISPAKTWEGFAGALVFSLIASFGSRALLPTQLAILNWTDALILGLALSIAAVFGDLAESILKRGTAVKDSGHALPGIGGVLDLIDSILLTAPLLYFYLLWKLHGF